MALRNRSWSVNNTKESLLKEIDDEISKVYQIINKYSSDSSEKYFILGLIVAIVAAIFALYQNYILNLPHSDFFLYYLIAACLVIFYWTYAERAGNFIKKILKIPIVDDIDKEKNPIELNLITIFSTPERMRLRILLQYDWQFSKKGEPHFRAFSIFLISIVVISYANIQGWLNIPHLNDQMLFGIGVSWALIVYSLIIMVSILNPNIMTLFWESIFTFSDKVLRKNNGKNKKLLLLGFLVVIFGFLPFIFWTIIFNIFPLILLYYFVMPNIPFLLANFPTNLLILILFMLILNYFVEFIALIFGLNLVENVLNEKIWWLEKIKIELSERGDGTSSLETLYKKLDFSDLYVPVPIRRYLVFQKYVLFPNWLLKEWIDIEHCDELEFVILKERFQSQKMTLYETRPFYHKPR